MSKKQTKGGSKASGERKGRGRGGQREEQQGTEGGRPRTRAREEERQPNNTTQQHKPRERERGPRRGGGREGNLDGRKAVTPARDRMKERRCAVVELSDTVIPFLLLHFSRYFLAVLPLCCGGGEIRNSGGQRIHARAQRVQQERQRRCPER